LTIGREDEMRATLQVLAVAAMAVGLGLLPAGAAAETIRVNVTSGGAGYGFDEGGNFFGSISIAGDFGFSLLIPELVGAELSPFQDCCLSPNRTTRFSLRWTGSDTHNENVLTLLGTTYVNVGNLVTPTQIWLGFSSDPVTLPPLGNASASVEAPFRFTGFFENVAETEVLQANLTGAGIGRLFLTPFPSGWEPRSATFEFATTQAPVPEPSTLLLVGGALVTYSAKRRKRDASGVYTLRI
jgi:PEP-CTERM motif-containing protein